MPICKSCGLAYLDSESHACAQRPALGSARRELRQVLIAWAVSLGLCVPLVFMTGDLLSPAMVLISLVDFPSGLSSLFGIAFTIVSGGSPLGKSIAGWILYAVVTALVLSSNRGVWHRRAFILLCILLAANVAGCYIPILGAR